MEINYLLSDTTKSATSMAINEIVGRAEKEPFSDFIVLVPETKSIIIEKELLDRSGRGAFLNVSVYSFVRLLGRIGNIPASKIVNKQTCIIILRKIISDLSDQLICYKKTAKAIGFAEKMYETIQQLKSSQILPQDLETPEVDDESLKLKLKDIALIYLEYEKFLSGKYMDDCDKLNLLSSVAGTSPVLKNAHIFIVGFDNITGEMEGVLKNLAVHSKSITFSCVYFPHPKSYIFSNELYDKFKRIADELKYSYFPKKGNAIFKGDFYRIANNLFDGGKKIESDGSVLIYAAKTAKEEVEFVANQIHRLVMSGKRYKDIGVLACNLSETEELIKTTFEDYGIPYFVNSAYTISNHFFASFIKSAVQIFSTHLDYRSVLEFLSCPILEIEGFGDFQNFVNEVGVNYGDFLTFDLEKNAELIKKYQNLSENLEFLRKFYNKFAKKLKDAKTISGLVTVLLEMFDFLEVKGKLEKISEFEKENSFVIEGQVTEQIYQKVTSFNELLCNFLGNKESSIDEFLNLYMTGFDVIKINLAPVSVDCVVVQENTDGFYDIDTMFLMGAVEGSFPCKLSDTGIILDKELDKINKLSNKNVEPTVRQINRRESFRAFECLLEPKKQLFVSYSLKSAGGSPNVEADLVGHLVEMFGKEIIKSDYQFSDFVNFRVQEKRFCHHAKQYLQGTYTLAELNKEYNALNGHLSAGLKEFIDRLGFSAPEFVIDASGLYFYNDTTSVSQLENYFSCPYKFFANYGLRIKKKNDYKLNFMDIGNIIHKLVELFMDEIDSYEGVDEKVFAEKVCKLLYKSLELNKINVKSNQSVVNSLEGEAIRICKALWDEQQASGFKNDRNLNEFEFKGKNGIKFKLDSGRVISIEGKIDRIDRFGNYIRIIDYKTGKVECSLSPIYFGKKIQLVSYLSAIENIEDKNGQKCKVAGLFYLPIHSDFVDSEKKSKSRYKMVGILLDDMDVVKNMDHDLSFEHSESNLVPIKILTNANVRRTNEFVFNSKNKTTLSEEQIESIKKYTTELCKTAMQEILDGYIEPSPLVMGKNEDMTCQYCEFNGFCGKENARFPYGRVCSESIDISDFEQEGEDGQK